MNGRNGRCKGACCKTPYGVCAKRSNCACHWQAANKDQLQAAIEEQNAAQRRMLYQEALRGMGYGNERQRLYAKRHRDKQKES